ncbi:unnamed protein product [Closterium sp. Naga37s-1]|nr:unnamed protein product [Closterium sp. Naga37s-1]
MFPFGPFQPLRCSRGEGIASREPLAETPSPGGGGEACERGGASVNPLESGLPASHLQLVLVAGDTTALPPPVEEPSAWPWTWQERLRAVKRRRMDARECEGAAHVEAGGTGGAQDWGKLEAEAEEERRRKQRLGILSGMRQMLDSPGFAAARGQKKRRFIVRQGGLRHRLPTMRGTSSASASGDQSSEHTNSEGHAAEAAREVENARAAADVATLATHNAAQLAVGGRVGAAGGVDATAAAPHHARELGSSVATVRIGGSSTGRNGGRNGGGGRGGEYEVESTQCAAEMAEEGSGLAERGEAAHPISSPCLDADEAERAGEKRKANEAQAAADGAAGRAHVRRRHGLPSRLGGPAAMPSTAAPVAPPAKARFGIAPPALPRALPSAPNAALAFPLLSSDAPHRSRPPLPCRITPRLAEPVQARQTGHPVASGAAAAAAASADAAAPGSAVAAAAAAAAAAIAASVDFPLWVRQLQACAGAGEEEGRASECTGETPGSMLEAPEVQPDMEGSGSGGSGSSGEGSGGEEDGEVESSGGSGSGGSGSSGEGSAGEEDEVESSGGSGSSGEGSGDEEDEAESSGGSVRGAKEGCGV